MEFPYTWGNIDRCEAFPDGPAVGRPILPIQIGINGVWTDFIQGIVDTGADYCVFYGNFAEQLGLEWEKLPIAPALGLGKNILRVASIDLDAGELGIWPIRAAFTPHPFPFALLGHVGFLEKLKFSTIIDSLDCKKSRFTLERAI
jgi:hypothetical protein